MTQDLKNRTYKLSTQTCKQIDYLHFLIDKTKPEIIEDAVDLLFTAYAILPKELKSSLLGISLEGDDVLMKVLEDLQKHLTESFQKKTL